ncbi:hypothetical protein QYM36_016642 [Artemia franciscana]|uniref:RNase H type-1 domain-containing protein n=1 Tax=Artemia franciscana TaxID=6661 RepID=A0AA88HF61_ARTSF|nr:hypothetical protein QYM36_016642 [Artemia franciscana]
MMMEKEYKGYLQLFTEGSKVDEMKHVGAAFWCPFKNVSKKFKLPPESSVFLAEAYVIKKVLEFIEESVKEDKVIIFYDSKSAIQAVVNANTMAKPNRDVLICYIKLQDILKKKKVVIQWIPAHIGIAGNEIADLKAKSAVESGTLVTDMDTPYEVKIFDKVIKVIDRQGNDGFLASYEISKIIVKAGKPHNIGETVILPAVSAIISSVVKQNAIEITNSIPLSNSSVSRRIDEMVEEVEQQLIAHLQVKQFALQLDESALRDNEALLLAFVRFNNEGAKEEMLFARSITTDTKGETIFNEVATYFKENNVPLKNIIACATDGAPSVTGRYKGFIAH